jgi:hypothetical protein
MTRTVLLGFGLVLLSLFPSALSAQQYASAPVTLAAYHYDRECDRDYYRSHRDWDDRRWRYRDRDDWRWRRERGRDRDERYWDRGGYWR